MKLQYSTYLEKAQPAAEKLVKKLSTVFPYASILGQDSSEESLSVARSGINAGEGGVFTNRGFAVRVHTGTALCEYSFNELSEDKIPEIVSKINRLAATCKNNAPMPADEPAKGEYFSEFELDPDEVGKAALIEKLSDARQRALSHSDKLIDCMVRMQWCKKHNLFLSPNRTLRQSVLWTNMALVALCQKDGDVKDYYSPMSGLCGAELTEKLTDEKLFSTVDSAVELLSSEHIVPGEYECICDPEVTGMIVHEAFGHGVEMDMFVKDRALARQYVGKRVASDLVTMHDGASAADECATFLFDDEGNTARDTLVIDKGILVSGYADELSARRLNVQPTGNGRRESFERKAYTRMTNTYFEAGKDKLEDMIASVKYGFMLVNPSSGMEDPKNWGIQCMVNVAKEIKDGKLTGKVFSPIVLTGYVPDLLQSISMVSDTRELCGTGACGKGYKEWVKVSDGGPWIKARIRLG